MNMRRPRYEGLDGRSAKLLDQDVAADRDAFMNSVRELREQTSTSIEEISFLLGVHTGRLSRQLRGEVDFTLTSYLRLVRAFGYRCQIVLEKTDEVDTNVLSNLKLGSRRVTHQNR